GIRDDLVTGVQTCALPIFAWFVYEVIEHRLAAEVDRQLRIDFDLVEAQLSVDTQGRMQWNVRGSHGDEGFARMSAWFEVWSENKIGRASCRERVEELDVGR